MPALFQGRTKQIDRRWILREIETSVVAGERNTNSNSNVVGHRSQLPSNSCKLFQGGCIWPWVHTSCEGHTPPSSTCHLPHPPHTGASAVTLFFFIHLSPQYLTDQVSRCNDMLLAWNLPADSPSIYVCCFFLFLLQQKKLALTR